MVTSSVSFYQARARDDTMRASAVVWRLIAEGEMMYLKMAKRLLFETDKRLLWKLAWNMGWKGIRSVQKHKQRLKRGEVFPPFLYVSIINSCNLRCQVCGVDEAAKQATVKRQAMNQLIHEAWQLGNAFFVIVGW